MKISPTHIRNMLNLTSILSDEQHPSMHMTAGAALVRVAQAIRREARAHIDADRQQIREIIQQCAPVKQAAVPVKKKPAAGKSVKKPTRKS